MAALAGIADAGCRLTHFQLRMHVPKHLRDAGAAGVTVVVTTGVSLRDSRSALNHALSHHRARAAAGPAGPLEAMRMPRLYCTVGVHPQHVAEVGEKPEKIAQHLHNWCTEAGIPEAGSRRPAAGEIADGDGAPIVAIGLCGLDNAKCMAQRAALRAQLEVAAARGLPAVVHAKAGLENDVLDELAPFLLASAVPQTPSPSSPSTPTGAKSSQPRPRLPGAMLQGFSGDVEAARRAVALGVLLSASGVATRSRMKPLLNGVFGAPGVVPDAFLLVESCAPFLRPHFWGDAAPPKVPGRERVSEAGHQLCRPRHAVDTLDHIAAARRVPLAALAATTAANWARLFRRRVPALPAGAEYRLTTPEDLLADPGYLPPPADQARLERPVAPGPEAPTGSHGPAPAPLPYNRRGQNLPAKRTLNVR